MKNKLVLIAIALLLGVSCSNTKENGGESVNVDSITTFGIYSYKGANYEFDETTDQISRLYDTDGTVDFSLLKPSEGKYFTVGNIDPNASEGDTMTIEISENMSSRYISSSMSVEVSKKLSSKMWLKSTDGTVMLVKI